MHDHEQQFYLAEQRRHLSNRVVDCLREYGSLDAHQVSEIIDEDIVLVEQVLNSDARLLPLLPGESSYQLLVSSM